MENASDALSVADVVETAEGLELLGRWVMGCNRRLRVRLESAHTKSAGSVLHL
jgi:N-acyl-D-aspartate/D-glutamate deacylase